MRKLLTILPMVGLVVGISACREELEPGAVPGKADKSTISFVIGGDDAQTKSGAASMLCEPIDLSEETGISEFMISETVSSLDDVSPVTKGTPIYTENMATTVPSLYVTPYEGTTSFVKWHDGVDFAYDESASATAKAKVYSYNFTDNTRWPDDGDLLFFFQSPKDAVFKSGPTYEYSANTNGYGTISFSYATPGANTGTNAATLQKDILFSSKMLSQAENEDTTPDKVLLYHVFTGVKFQLLGGTSANGKKITIKSLDEVKFEGVVSEGSCVVTPTYEGYSSGSNKNGGVPKSSEAVVWTPGTTTASFTQAFTATEGAGNDVAKDGKFADSFYTGTAANKNVNDANLTKTFMFIPQTLTDNVKLTITYTYNVAGENDEQNTLTIDFGTKMIEAAGTATDTQFRKIWKAGELRTYNITVGDVVDVDITDTVVDQGTTAQPMLSYKKDLTIKNTGTAPAYMRVAVIGNWYSFNSSSALTEEEEEELAFLAPEGCITPCVLTSYKEYVNDELWKEGTDGYWYYKHPVPAGHTILAANTLFSNGTAYFTEKAPYKNCNLHVDLAVQAVRVTEIGDAIAAGFNGVDSTWYDTVVVD